MWIVKTVTVNISSFWCRLHRAPWHHIWRNQLLHALGHWVANFPAWMNYSSVSSSDRGSRESTDLQRTFTLAVIQPEKGRGGKGGGGLLFAIQMCTLGLIKARFPRSALSLQSKLCTHMQIGAKEDNIVEWMEKFLVRFSSPGIASPNGCRLKMFRHKTLVHKNQSHTKLLWF